MKIDSDYIEKILKAVENCSDPRMKMHDLVKAIDLDLNQVNENDVNKFYYHMKRIEEAGFMTCTHGSSNSIGGFGFVFHGREIRLVLNAAYELTWDGHNFLQEIFADMAK